MIPATYTLSQITARLGGEWRGEDISITAVRPLADAQAEHISFLANPKYKAEVHDSSAGAVIVSAKAADGFEGRNLIVADDPYLYFAKSRACFHPSSKRAAASIRPPSSNRVPPFPQAAKSARTPTSARTPCSAKAAASWQTPSSNTIAV